MLSLDEMTAAMGAARDQALAVILDHEKAVHDGAPCWGNRASAVAHLAHCLGVRGEVWHQARELLANYDARCPGQGCPHPTPPAST